MDSTTLSVDKPTRERLKHFGTKGEDYDRILNRMMDILEEMNLDRYIDEKYRKLVKDRKKFISLEEYESKSGSVA